MPKSFVCGHPIGHSRSPKIHGFWLREHRLEGSYEAVDVAPDRFPAFMKSLGERQFAGGNVTIPHKEAAFELADDRDAAAEAIGAANTLWFEDGRLVAGNTDAYGFLANLDDRAPGWDKRRDIAVVLGAGGAARAVVYALKARGFQKIRIVNRTLERARALANRFGPESSGHGLAEWDVLLEGASLLVNTTPTGMQGHDEGPSHRDLSALPDHSLVTDLVYVPLETPFLASAGARGLRTIDGLGMLLHQAVPGFERWFGVRPHVGAELRRVIVADIGNRAP